MLRGEYDARKVERAKEAVRRFAARVREATGFEEPRPTSHRGSLGLAGGLHRGVLAGAVILIAAVVLAAFAVPGAAVLGSSVRGLAKRFGGGIRDVDLPAIAQRSIVLARDGRVIATLAGEENRMVVPLSRVPPVTQQAVLAIEDARFYEHRGVDVTGLLRALISNARAGQVREGGSTITQQLVKNVLVGGARNIDRKIREAQIAVAIEKRYTKRQILELYLNESYFGGGVYGIGTAAEFYFGKDVAELDVAQSALLAGLIKAPEEFHPLRFPSKARARRTLVLKRMADEGFISEKEAERATRASLGVAQHALPKPRDPYFVEFVKAQILDDPRFGATRADRASAIFQGGLRIETTLDLKLQVVGRRAASEVLDEADDPAAALVSIDAKTGRVVAMVGGRDFNRAKYNLAVQGKRQAGSAFKPFTLVAALDAGLPPGLTFATPSPIEIRDAEGKIWKVQNYSHRSEGTMDMRRATELSVNTYYAQLIDRVGPERVVEAATRLGIQSELKPYLSLALGTFSVSPYEMASAYATLANRGIYCKPFAIVRITDSRGSEIMRNDPDCSRRLDASVAAQASTILQGVVERGTGRANGKIGRPVAAKTGTTDEYTDAWFVGYTPNYATAVWLGYPESTKRKLYNIHGLPRVFGGSLPATIWNKFMRAAHEGVAVERFPTPPPTAQAVVPDVKRLPVAQARGILEQAGFTVRIRTVASALAPGVVAAQDPPAGTTVEGGSIVTLRVSDGTRPPGSAPTPSPEPCAGASCPQEPTPSPSPSPSRRSARP